MEADRGEVPALLLVLDILLRREPDSDPLLRPALVDFDLIVSKSSSILIS